MEPCFPNSSIRGETMTRMAQLLLERVARAPRAPRGAFSALGAGVTTLSARQGNRMTSMRGWRRTVMVPSRCLEEETWCG